MAAERTLEDVRQYLRRIIGVERVVLFVKLAVIGFAVSVVLIGVPLQPTAPEFPGLEPGGSEAALLKTVLYFKLQLLLYTVGNGIFWFCLFVLGRRISRYLFVKTTAFFLVIVDMLFVTLLIWLLPGLQKSLFWLYCFVLVHAVLLFPDALTMGVLTAICAAFLVCAGALPPTEDSEAEVETEGQQGAEPRAMTLNIVILAIAGAGFWGGNRLIQSRLRALGEDQERVIRTEKLNLAGLIATSIAHELKNPLAIMNNAAFLLRRADELDPKLKKQVNIIVSEIQRSDKIIMELLGYAKLAEGRIDRVSVNDVLDEAAADLKNEVDTRRIVVAKAYARHLPPLLIDPAQLRTLASNLLLNACEAIESLGRITVTTGYSDDGFIEISIADTGKGIPEENLPKVFESFFTTKESGTGLGLSIVNSIANAYGGSVAVESQVGKGSTFIVRLPTRTARGRAARGRAGRNRPAHDRTFGEH